MNSAAIPISVIIPAHNEEAVIERSLRTMLADAEVGDSEILVVCNGCSDRTAEIAGAFGPPVRVLELDKGSKPLALNTGDRHAKYFPRFYVDADIDVTFPSLQAAAAPLAACRALVAAPGIRVATEHSSAAVRMYYQVWTRLPYITNAMVGSGIYGLSQAGRARFESFPDIIGDDAFVRRNFRVDERVSVLSTDGGEPVSFTVYPPRTLPELMNIEVRRKSADIEIDAIFAGQPDGEKSDQRSAIARLAANPRNWPALAVYFYVKLESRRRFRVRQRRGTGQVWLRDESSRSIADG